MKRKLLLVNSAIIAIGLVVVFFISAFQVRERYNMEFERQLNMVLSALSLQREQIEADPERVAQTIGDVMTADGQEIRISVIETDGTVVGDSYSEDIHTNHLNRPEVQEALSGGYGYDLRTSETTNQRYLYAAVKLDDQYILRAALPTATMDESLQSLWEAMVLCLFLGVVIVCILTAIIASRTIHPLQALTTAAEKISRGDFSSRVPAHGHDEVAQLSESFNRMASSVETALRDLRYNQDLLKGVLEAMADGVLAVGPDHRVLFFNDRARTLLKPAHLTVGGLLEGGLTVAHVSKILEQTRQQRETFTEELMGNDPGQSLTVYTSLVEDGETVIAVISDVSRVKKLERMRSEFVGNVTHELKTPLTSIRASIELLKSGNRDEETRSYFYDVLDMEAERLQHLIDDMLSLSRLENMRSDPSVQPCSVLEAAQVSAERLQIAAEKNQVSVSIQVDPKLYVRCTPSRLEQLLSNLIENAIKYNKPGGRVEVTGVQQQEIAILHVRDTGIGIPPEHIPRLFERFYRVDTSRSRAIGGTGLGLSIVKHIAVLYGGEVHVESTPGVGSVFTVRLPRCQAPEVPSAEHAGAEETR